MKPDQLNEARRQPIQQQTPIIRAKNLEKKWHLKEGTEILLKPTPQQENINPALLKKKRQKKEKVRPVI